MKKILDAVGRLADIYTVSPLIWSVVVGFVLGLLGLLFRITEFFRQSVHVQMPLLVILLALAAYPPLKLVQRYLQYKSHETIISFEQLKWRISPGILWDSVKPACPHCGRDLVITKELPGPVLVTNWSNPIPDLSIHYRYNCIEHGCLLDTPKSLSLLEAYVRTARQNK